MSAGLLTIFDICIQSLFGKINIAMLFLPFLLFRWLVASCAAYDNLPVKGFLCSAE